MLKYPERSNDYEGELEDGTCAQLLSWPGRAARKRARRDRRRDDGLPRLRHVRARDEPSIWHVPADHRRRRGNPASPAEHPQQLPCPVFAGRRHAAVCGHPHEPHAPRPRRLRRDRQLCQQGVQGGRQVRRGRAARELRGHQFRPHTHHGRRQRAHCRQGRGRRARLRLHLPEQHHLWHHVPRAARLRRRTAGRRCLELLFVAAARRRALRTHLRRRAEKRRRRGRDRGHRARRPHHRWPRLCADAAVHGP